MDLLGVSLHHALIPYMVLAGALALDLLLGEYPARLHPTVWMGRLISVFKPRLKHRSRAVEYVRGFVLAIGLVSAVYIIAYCILYMLDGYHAVLIMVSVLALKSTFALRAMEEHARAVMDSLMLNDMASARYKVSMIVGRDTSNLDEEHILSATIESIGESTVDGVTAPLFYYALLGVPAALAYRAINTLDSMLGYRDEYHRHIGYASAKLDTIANYIPARLTALAMVIASMLLRLDWRNAMRIMLRDRHNTPSVNSGYPMSVMAGALRIRLEKIGYYRLGDGEQSITVEHCRMALKVMKVSSMVFIALVVLPLLLV
ncbi:MAG: cobalamin biosynthesis protein [Candidatus Nitrosocaldus sp.]|nr:cobalamin biosynthesis protein [Candidatus Nitrosocaldus sp.]MCS7140801.1 cobalamin biosynthesis protein [Candidatus Nitrosocaldus sp.]MDW7999729.1 cobalamin biosynthesis protein [Candidatus Nitrosocaldus sp.]MDW8274911.1 cobalamin biosynthesis protein [Candidatus Nitrosocaldus sp.]